MRPSLSRSESKCQGRALLMRRSLNLNSKPSPIWVAVVGILGIVILGLSTATAAAELPVATGRSSTSAAGSAGRSCGSVVIQGTLRFRLAITKGSPSCGAVRRIGRRYGHPTSTHPRFFCATHAYECEYSIYPAGWRCGGLFQGYFDCWHGSNSPLKASQEFEGSELPDGVGGASVSHIRGTAKPSAVLSSIGLLDARGSALAATSCGSVPVQHDARARLTITKGSPSCNEVRAIAKQYGHPREVRSYCHPSVHICEYGVYPKGWRCTGLFQGTFGCWLGGDARGRGARASFSGKLVY